MTSPAPEQAQQPPQEDHLVRDIAAILAVGASMAAVGAAVALLLAPLGLGAGVAALAVKVAYSKVFGGPPSPSRMVAGIYGVSGDASGSETAQDSQELYYRAAFILNASKRIDERIKRGQTAEQAVAAERANVKRHLDARARRAEIARQVAEVAKVHGPLLGWYAKMDARTSAECRAANGKNFDAETVPVIGYPGSVHPNCRCAPGAPFATDAVLPARPTVAAAIKRVA